MLFSFPELTKKYNMKINGIIHIGAHLCQELKWYNDFGIMNDKIIWIEANPNLVKKNLDIDKTRIVKNFCATNTDEGFSILNISNKSQSSSILEFGTHQKNYPSIKYISSIEVKNKRIDTCYIEDNIPKDFANFVNLDIQGTELFALIGMGDLLNEFDYIYTEVNKEYVYKNCSLINEIDIYLKKFNFKRVETLWMHQNWGDAFYIKEKILP